MSSNANPSRFVRKSLSVLAAIGLVGTLTVFAASTLFQAHWAADAFAHFVPFYAIGFAVFAIMGRRWIRIAAIASLLVAITYIAMSPVNYVSAFGKTDTATTKSFKLLSLNLNWFQRYGPVLDSYIAKEQPDLAVFTEVSPYWLDTLRDIASRRSFAFQGHAETGLYSSAILSRFPLNEVRYARPGRSAPKLQAAVDIAGRTVRIGGVHMLQPLNPRTNALQRREIDQIAEYFRQAGNTNQPVILAGDFNSTPWSFISRRLYAETGLKTDLRLMAGSWPAASPIRIPIDHVFHSDDLVLRHIEIGDNLGSDHRPILAVFSLKPPSSSR